MTTSKHAKPVALLLMCGLILGLCALSATAAADTPPSPESKTLTWSQDKRYSDNGDKTITDHKNGLMWTQMDAFQMQGHFLNWKESFAFVDQLNQQSYANYNDWRVPSKNELVLLYEAEKTNTALGMVAHIDPIFPQNGMASYWSSESNGEYNAFGVVFNTGAVFNAPKLAKSQKTVRAVRTVQ